MNEDLKGLIQKIQEEGVQAAEAKAKAIEEEAVQKAASVIKDAQKKAEKLISEAGERIKRNQKSAEDSLDQAARDLLIVLRSQINAMLKKIILLDVREALGREELAGVILSLIKESAAKAEKGNIVISLNKDDLEKVKKTLFVQLKEEVKNKIVMKASEDIQAGFSISYDAGKSQFEFTDKALAEYLSISLDPKLGEVIKSTLKERK
jgi:V/A-type H+-transporting ATPase subunit E